MALVAGLILPALPTPVVEAQLFPPAPPAPAYETRMEVQGDGDKAAAAPWFDWNQIQNGPVPGPYTFGPTVDSAGIVARSFQQDLNGSNMMCSGADTSANSISQFPDSNTSTAATPVGSTNFAGWVIGQVNNPQAKVDACSVAAAVELVRVHQGGYDQLHYVLYQYITRAPSGTGSLVTFTMLEGPAPGRCDDRLLKFDFNPNNDSTVGTAQRWTPTSNDNCADPFGAGSWSDTVVPAVFGTAGSNTDPVDGGTAGAGDGSFIEIAADLTAAGLIPSDTCVNYTAAGAFTQTGNDGQLQDFVAYANPLVVSNCNSLTVSKVSNPNGLSNANPFTYVVDQTDARTVHSTSLTGTVADQDASVNSITAAINVGDTHTWNNVIAEPDYRVLETALPTGWQQQSVVCTYKDVLTTGDGVATPGQPGFKTVTISTNGAPSGQTFDMFPPQVAPAPSCVITNTASGIRIVKDAAPDDAQDFGFTATGSAAPSPFSLDDDADGTLPNSRFFVLAPGQYTVSEGATSGWDLTNLTCQDATTNSSADIATATATIDVGAAEVVTCTFTNTKRGSITIVKDAAPDDARDFAFGGTLGTFTLDDDGVGGSATPSSETFTNLLPGNFDVTEAVAAGWTLGNIACSDGSTVDVQGRVAHIALGAGEDVTCTFTNDVNTATLTLTKQWTGPGSDAVSLTADGNIGPGAGTGDSTNGGATTDATVTIRGGEQVALAEAFTTGDSANYDTTLVCTDATGLTYTAGDLNGSYTAPAEPVDVTCTFTNARKSAPLKLQKSWGANSAAGDMTNLTIDGIEDETATDVTAPSATPFADTTIYAGETVTLSEVLAAGNTASYTANLVCVGDSGLTYDAGDSNGTFVVDSTPAATVCTFTNTRDTTTLVLGKHWVNGIVGHTVQLDAGGGISTGVTANSVANTDDQTTALTVYSGESIDLTEDFLNGADPALYTTSLSCTSGSLTYAPGTATGSVVVPKKTPGEALAPITCTFSNSRNAAQVVVRKELTDPLNAATFDVFVNDGLPGNAPNIDDAGVGTTTSQPVAVSVGDEVSVHEVADAAFTSTLTCDNGITPAGNNGTSGSFTVPAALADQTITCTFTNVRKQADLTLTKVWVNGAAGDTATLDADATNPIVGLLSTAGSPQATQTVAVYAGEAVDLSEVLGAGNTGSYGSALSCTAAGLTGVPVDGRSGTYTMPAAAASVTCTFTNTRLTNAIVLQKAWVDGKQGDTATLVLNGSLVPPGRNTSTVGVTPTFVDAANTATLTVLTGSTVTLDETLGGTPDGYTSSLTCDTATPTVNGPTSGTVQVPSAADVTTTCTFTNTRKQVGVTVTKALTDPVSNSSFDLTINGAPGLTGTTGGAVSPATTVLVGDAVNVAETASTGSLDNFDSTLTCTLADGTPVSLTSNSGIAGTFTVPASAHTSSPILCTFTNVRKSVDLTLQKAWVTPVNGDTANLTVDPTARPEISNANSVAPGTTPVTLTVYAGEAVSLQEALAAVNVGGYTPNLACDQPGLDYTAGLLSGTYTVPSSPQAVTCTFTNTRTTATIRLAKAWANAKDGDEVNLTIGSPTGGPAQATSTAPAAGQTAQITVLTGETVNLAEAFNTGDPANYVTSLACPGAANAPTYTPDALTGTLAIAKADASAQIVCTFTNGRGTAQVVVAKDLTDPLTPQASFDLSIDGTVEVTDAQDGDSNAATPVTVNLGDTVTVSEDVNVSFDSALTCVEEDQTPVTVTPNAGTSGSFVVPASAADQVVTCTFTNTRNAAPLNLQKVWVDGAVGDSADLTIDGVNDDDATSEAPDAPEASNTAAVDVYAGETVTLDEDLVTSGGTYTTTLMCGSDVITLDTELAGSFTMPAVPDDVTCTFTNTRTRATLSLQKVWVNGHPGDTAGLTIGATLGGDTASSTANDAPAPGNTATATVLSGEVVDLGETLSGTGGYDTTLLCGGVPVADFVPATLDGTYTVPATPADVTCTFTNTRRSATLTLTKAWVDALTGEQASLTANGSSEIEGVADGTSTAPSTTTPATLTMYAGETVSLDESFGVPANAPNYATTLVCTDANGLTYSAGALGGTYSVPADPADVTCTFTNTRRSTTLTLQKVWVDGAAGDTAGLTIAGDAGTSPLATSRAPDAPAPGNQATLTVFAGETVDLNEALDADNTGSYDTTLVCGQQQLSTTTSGVYTVPAVPAPVTCTFTNTRQRSTLTLHKTWVDAAAGDSTVLTLTGTQGAPTDTSIATGAVGAQDDTTNTVTLTVLSGEVVNLMEAITGVGIYGITLSCTGGGTLTYNGGTAGTVTAPKTSGGTTDCVFTNTAGRGTIIINKTVAGTDRTFTFNGNWAGASPTFGVTTGGQTPGTGQAMFGGVLAGSYSVSEQVPTGWVLTGLTCAELDGDGNTTFTATVGTLDLDAGETVTCTFTNAQRGPLDVTKTVTSGPTFVSGTTYRVVYEVEVTSASHIDETYNLSDTLQFGSGVTIVSATPSPAAPGWTGVAPNTALVTGGTIPALGTVTYTITVDASVDGAITPGNRDCVQSDGEGTGFLNAAQVTWQDGSDTADDCVEVPDPNLTITKTVSSAPAKNPDGTYTLGYDVTVANTGAGPGSYTLTDTFAFAAGVSVVSTSAANTAPGGIATNAGFNGASDPVVATSAIASGASHVYRITVTANVGGVHTIAETDCTLDPGETGTGFLNRAQVNPTAEACAPIPPEADVAVVKTADPEAVTFEAGSSATVGWTIVVTNNGPVQAIGVVLDDTIPAAFIAATAATTVGTCSVSGQAVHCDLGTIAFGASVTVTVTATTAPGIESGTYTNVAVVGSSSPTDPNPANNTDDAATAVTVVAVQVPPPTSPPPTAPPEPPVPSTLPETGGNTVGIQYLGALALGLGLVALLVTRRRRSRSIHP